MHVVSTSTEGKEGNIRSVKEDKNMIDHYDHDANFLNMIKSVDDALELGNNTLKMVMVSGHIGSMKQKKVFA